jgi:hypothetical protein
VCAETGIWFYDSLSCSVSPSLQQCIYKTAPDVVCGHYTLLWEQNVHIYEKVTLNARTRSQNLNFSMQELLEELFAVQSVLISARSNTHPLECTQTTKCHGPSVESLYSGKVNGIHFPGDSKSSNELLKLKHLTFHLTCTINTGTAYVDTSQTALMFPELVNYGFTRALSLCLLPASGWFLRPWTWMRSVPAKLQLTFNGLQGVINHRCENTVSWNMRTCSLVEGDQLLISLKTETSYPSETWVPVF